MKTRTLACASALFVVTFGLPSHSMAQSLEVVATFSILGDFAREVGGDRIELTTLVGPDSDAHVFEPRPADAMALARADVILMNGLLMEGFMSRLVAASGTDATIVELSEGAHLIEDPQGGHYHHGTDGSTFHAAPYDPHAWQSVANAKIYVANVADAFCAADADGCEIYRANAGRYIDELDALDVEMRASLSDIEPERRTVVLAHNAFRYFGDAYGITFLSPQGVSTDSEASAADVAGLVRQMREDGVRAVFAENVSDSRLVERIAAEADTELSGTLYSDALSGPEGVAPTYAAMMSHNVETIRRALAAD